jgi:hypothetical protein
MSTQPRIIDVNININIPEHHPRAQEGMDHITRSLDTAAEKFGAGPPNTTTNNSLQATAGNWSISVRQPHRLASAHVFGVTELCENVLIPYLLAENLLRMRSVCRRFHDIINRCPTCQEKLFLAPISRNLELIFTSSTKFCPPQPQRIFTAYTINPFIAGLNAKHSIKNRMAFLFRPSPYYESIIFSRRNFSVPFRHCLCYNMFFSQPPTSQVRLHITGVKARK